MPERAVIAGVGMVPFTSVRSNAAEIAERAVRSALADAGLDAELVDQAVAAMPMVTRAPASVHFMARESLASRSQRQ